VLGAIPIRRGAPVGAGEDELGMVAVRRALRPTGRARRGDAGAARPRRGRPTADRHIPLACPGEDARAAAGARCAARREIGGEPLEARVPLGCVVALHALDVARLAPPALLEHELRMAGERGERGVEEVLEDDGQDPRARQLGGELGERRMRGRHPAARRGEVLGVPERVGVLAREQHHRERAAGAQDPPRLRERRARPCGLAASRAPRRGPSLVRGRADPVYSR